MNYLKILRAWWVLCSVVNYLCSALQFVLMFTSNALPWWGFLLWSAGSFIFATVLLKAVQTDEMWAV